MGGESRTREKARLRRGVQVIVATPGRLLDHLQSTAVLDVGQVEWLVLDEADRLLDLGFERELTAILSHLEAARAKAPAGPTLPPPAAGTAPALRRQTVLVSATIDARVRRLAEVALDDPVHIGFDEKAETEEVGGEAGEGVVGTSATPALPATIQHYVLQVESRHRLVALAAFLRREAMQAGRRGEKCKAVVFFSTCNAVAFHHALFSAAFWPPGAKEEGQEGSAGEGVTALIESPLYQLHGQMGQKERTAAYHAFSSASSAVLLCTDVAARGLDLPAVDWVVQYDVGEAVDDYVHRVGRCGRIGREGKAVIFLTEKEKGYLTLLPPEVKVEPLSVGPLLSSLRVGGMTREGPPAGAVLQRLMESMVSGDRALYGQAVSAYQSYVRAYAGYPKGIRKVMGGVGGLHLGHVCRSFGLGEEPTKVGEDAGGESGEGEGEGGRRQSGEGRAGEGRGGGRKRVRGRRRTRSG